MGICDAHEETVTNTLRCGGDSSRKSLLSHHKASSVLKKIFIVRLVLFGCMSILCKSFRSSWKSLGSHDSPHLSGDIDFIKQHLPARGMA